MPNTINSVQAYQTYGIAPTYLRFMIDNLFYFPSTHKDCLQTYFLQESSTKDFLDNIQDGTIYHEGCKYQVIYHKTDPTKLLRRQEHTSVKMSFREAHYEFNILPTVLVKEIIT